MSRCFEITVSTGSSMPDRKLRNAIKKAAAVHGGLRVHTAPIAKRVAEAVALVPGVNHVLIEKVTRTHVGVYRVPQRERGKEKPKVSQYRKA